MIEKEVFSTGVDARGAVADHFVSEKSPADKSSPTHVGKKNFVNHAPEMDGVAAISKFLENSITATVTEESKNVVSRTDTRLEAVLLGTAEKVVH